MMWADINETILSKTKKYKRWVIKKAFSRAQFDVCTNTCRSLFTDPADLTKKKRAVNW